MKRFFEYLKGLLYYQTNGTCADIAGMLLTMSHDTLRRFLLQEWSGQQRLDVLLFTIELLGGYLVVDDTVCHKPHAQTLEGLQYIFSTVLGKTVYGYNTVLLIWTDGEIRIPVSLRLWKRGEKTKVELALEMLSYARNHLKLKPQFVLFDSWYAARAILKRINDYGWYFITRLKENRKLEGTPLHKTAWRPYWHGTGKLQGGLKVFVVKNDHKFFATNRLTMGRKELLAVYGIRSQVEEVFRVLKQECAFSGCQLDSLLGQEHHRWCAVFAFLVLEKERMKRSTTIYKLRKALIRRDSILSLPDFDKLLEAA